MGPEPATPVSGWERLYFVAVGLLALWVGAWCFAAPSRSGRVLPFAVPPLHARFLGAMYLSGLAFMAGAAVARSWPEVRVVPAAAAVWTGGLLVVSLMHLDRFDLGEPQDQIWFGAYTAYPLLGAWLVWRHRAGGDERAPGRPVPRWAVAYLTGQGVAVTAVGLFLFLAPDAMARAWPWPVTGLLARIYSAPLLAYGVCSLLLARQRTWPEIRICAVAMFVFAAGVLVASSLHRGLFSWTGAAAWIWFGAFTVAAAALGAMAAEALRGRARVASA